MSTKRIREIWNQGRVPVILNRGKQKRPRLRLPFAEGNRAWLRNARRLEPEWHGLEGEHYWEVPRAWFSDLVPRCIERFGSVYVIQPFREHQKCAPACWDAQGDDCECSCMGANHGLGHPEGRWMILSDTFAASWGDEMWACRHLGSRGLIEAIVGL